MIRKLLFCLLPLVYGAVQAQDVTLELGFNGEMVAERWNPLRLQLRDHPAVTFTLTIDQGDLRGGEILAFYTINIPKRQGLTVIEDDIFLPAWRSLSWTVNSSERLLASGTFSRRQANDLPLSLILSSSPSQWLSFFEGSRPVETLAQLLPDRVASYDGVDYIMIDGTVLSPKLESLISAVTSGTTLVLLDSLGETYTDISALATGPKTRLGAGLIVQAPKEQLQALVSEAPRLNLEPIKETFHDNAIKPFPDLPSQYPVMAAAGFFVLAMIIVLRFGGNITLTTGLLLTCLASLLAWTWLKPSSATQQESSSYSISAGGLSFQQSFESYVSLPATELELPFHAYPSQTRPYTQNSESVKLDLERWSNLVFTKKPNLRSSELRYLEGKLILPPQLSSAYIKGEGFYPLTSQQRSLSPLESKILASLPDGSAIASLDQKFYIALPELSQ